MSEAISKAEMVKVSDLLDWAESVGGYCGDEVLSAIEAGKIPVIPTDVDVKEIEEALKKATPGEWKVTNLGDISITEGYRYEDGRHIATWIADMCDDDRDEEEIHADAYLIANSKKWLRQLLIKLAEKEAEVKQLNRQILDHYKTAKELFGGLSIDEFMEHYNDTLAQVEKYRTEAMRERELTEEIVGEREKLIIENESLVAQVAEKEAEVSEADAWCEYWRREAFRKYPTPEAYEAACKALHKHRERAEKAEAEVEKLKEEIGRRVGFYDECRTDLWEQEKKLNQAVEALENIEKAFKADDFYWRKLEYIYNTAHEALQSIKGGDPNVETTT